MVITLLGLFADAAGNPHMEIIFQLHFLKKIGWTRDKIKQIVKHNYRLKRKSER